MRAVVAASLRSPKFGGHHIHKAICLMTGVCQRFRRRRQPPHTKRPGIPTESSVAQCASYCWQRLPPQSSIFISQKWNKCDVSDETPAFHDAMIWIHTDILAFLSQSAGKTNALFGNNVYCAAKMWFVVNLHWVLKCQTNSKRKK